MKISKFIAFKNIQNKKPFLIGLQLYKYFKFS